MLVFLVVHSFVFLFGGCKFLAGDFYCFVNETDDTDTFLNSSNFHLQRRPSHIHCNTIHFIIIVNNKYIHQLHNASAFVSAHGTIDRIE